MSEGPATTAHHRPLRKDRPCCARCRVQYCLNQAGTRAGAGAPGGKGGSPGAGRVSATRRSVLVTFKVPGNLAKADAAVVPALRAGAAVQARHPGLRVQEAGDASTDRATTALISHDFRKAEAPSMPGSLILPIDAFAAPIAP